jgi:hypothetical protein
MKASAHFLNYGGQLQFVKSVLSSLPMFYLCSLKGQKTVLNTCDIASRHYLRAKEDDSVSSHSLATWSLVCRPKKFGGLEDLNLELQNKALLLKKLHKLYTKADIPLVKLVWDLYGDNVLFRLQLLTSNLVGITQ